MQSQIIQLYLLYTLYTIVYVNHTTIHSIQQNVLQKERWMQKKSKPHTFVNIALIIFHFCCSLFLIYHTRKNSKNFLYLSWLSNYHIMYWVKHFSRFLYTIERIYIFILKLQNFVTEQLRCIIRLILFLISFFLQTTNL